MIADLCNRIWNQNQFHAEMQALLASGLRASLVDDPCIDDRDSIPRLVQCATHLSLSRDPEHRRAAYLIAVNAWKLCKKLDIPDTLSHVSAAHTASIVLTRLGNFPADALLRTSIGKWQIPLSPAALWLEEQYHRDGNTVTVAENKVLLLTDFQMQLWSALQTYQFVVVNAPTSAGKSFALQNFVASMFAANKLNRAVYLVPTRALISQVMEDMTALLTHDLGMKMYLSEVPYDPDEDELVLFVLTQERLQILLDQSKRPIDFLVVDEAQGIAESSRGIILESVVERIREAFPNTSILFGSPYTRNPKVFSETFGLDPSSICVVETDESPVAQNLIHVQTNTHKPKLVRLSRVLDESTSDELCVLDMQTELIREDQTLAQLAAFLGKGALNIVYGSEPVKCERIAGLISGVLSESEIDQTDTVDLDDFAEVIREHVHKDFSLADFVKKGVAYHYGNLPAFLRKGMEHLFIDGKLPYIVCTSTLLQGVNLPAQNIFIMNPSKGVSRESREAIPLTPTEFWNLAGRAGRLAKDFEGNVHLINVSDWLDNPLGKPKKQEVYPSFSNYVCSKREDLLAFVSDSQHPSGASDGLESTFMKLFNDYNAGRLDSVLQRYEDRLSSEAASDIVAAITKVIEAITVPAEVTARNPNVSCYRQQDMLEYLLQRIEKKGPEYVMPPHPMLPFKKIHNAYLRFFKRMHTYFEKRPGSDKSHCYFAPLSLLWMRGMSYAELLRNRIEYANKQRKRGEANANTEARQLFREVESDLRFRYVKFSRCYADLLCHALSETGNEAYIESVPPIYLFLELGASSMTMMSLIGMGLTRTAASVVAEYAPRTDMARDEALEWLSKTNWSSTDISKAIIKEINATL